MATNQIEVLKTKALENRQKARPIETLIQNSLKELGKAVPSHLSAERLVRIALTTIRLNPKLTECTPESFLGALFQSAQLGLEPNVEGQAYIIPYTNSKKVGNQWVKVQEAQFQIGYKGYVELFYRHGSALSLDMQTVRENDIFEYEYGTDAKLKHCPILKNRGEIIAYYAVAHFKNGGKIFQVMSKDECMEHGKTHSKSFSTDASPWTKDPEAMCKKTVLIQLTKLLPKSIELQKAIAMDNTTKTRIDFDMFNIKDETNWEEPQEDDVQTSKVVEIQEYAEEEIN